MRIKKLCRCLTLVPQVACYARPKILVSQLPDIFEHPYHSSASTTQTSPKKKSLTEKNIEKISEPQKYNHQKAVNVMSFNPSMPYATKDPNYPFEVAT